MLKSTFLTEDYFNVYLGEAVSGFLKQTIFRNLKI